MKKALLVVFAILMVALPMFAQAAEEAKSSSGPDKLTYWAPMNAAITANDFSELPYWQEVMARTNTDIEFEHVEATDSVLKEQFNILIASGDYPDIIEYKWAAYAGGPQAAINDGVIIALNDIFEKYCPNITKYLNEHPDIAKECSTDDGTYYCFPFLRGSSYENNNLLFSEGWLYRQDILDSLGLAIPETADELYDVLVAIKNAGVVSVPMLIRPDHINRVFGPAFDSYGEDFYVVDGKVYQGYYSQNRYAYLQFVHKLYAEGLLDNDYLSANKKSLQSKLLSGAIAIGYAPGSLIATANETMPKDIPGAKIVSSKPLTSEKGTLSKYAKMSTVYATTVSSSAAITTSCKNIEAAARLLDYAYGEEGNLLANFGIEGVTYEMVNGYPTYTDFVNNNPEGLGKSQVMAMYMRCSTNGAMIQDPRYIEQYYASQEQVDALNLWAQTDYGKYQIPPVTISSDNAAESASIMNKVKTYADEMETKFITGALEINEATFAEYQAQLKAFGIERAIEIKQEAYEAYMAK